MDRIILFLFLFTSALVVEPPLVLAGASNATLQCKANSPDKSNMTLTGSIPGDFSNFNLKLASERGSVMMTSDKEKIIVITAFSNGVFTLAVSLIDSRKLLLYAIPKSVKAHENSYGEVQATFDAMLLEAPKPGYKGPGGLKSMIYNVPLSCTYEYSL